MATTWKINDVTFAARQLGNLRRTRVNLACDVVTFDAPASAFDDDAIFEYGDDVIIKKDSTRWFLGRVNNIPRLGDPSDERISYEVVGPWWWLENIVFQQSWKRFNTETETVEYAYKSRVILCQNASGDRINSGQQIAEAIDWAITRGAPISKGTIDPDIEIPWSEEVDISCADVIVKMLRWSPDCVCWFDYTGETPIFYCRKKSNLTAVQMAVDDGSPRQRISITPRYDLQVPGITLRYEQDTEHGDVFYETITEETAGDTGEPNSLVSTIELGGSTVTLLCERLETEDLPSDMNSETFWNSHIPWLNTVYDLSIHDAAYFFDKDNYPRILTAGRVHYWLQEYEDIDTSEEVITARADYTVKDGSGNPVDQVVNDEISVRLVVTNAETKWYRRIGSYENGEPVPSGLAAALYAAWNQLQYDGQISLEESDVGGALFVGCKLNCTGGPVDWESMEALVQQVTENVDTGLTTITIGPSRRIGIGELRDILFGFRSRRVPKRHSIRLEAKSRDAEGAVPVSGPHPEDVAQHREGEHRRLVVQNDGATKKIDSNPDDVTDASAHIKARKVHIYNGSDNFHTRWVMCSGAIDTGYGVSQITVVTDWRYDSSSHKIQVKTRDVRVLDAGAESGWTDKATAAECD